MHQSLAFSFIRCIWGLEAAEGGLLSDSLQKVFSWLKASAKQIRLFQNMSQTCCPGTEITGYSALFSVSWMVLFVF